MRIAILGAGAWGSALAVALSRGHTLSLWDRTPAVLEAIAVSRQSTYLPGIRIPESVALDTDIARAARTSDLVLVATSTAGLRPTLKRIADLPVASLLWACKGFDGPSGTLPHEIVADVLPRCRRAGALSGPSFALEVAQGLPVALTIASSDGAFAAEAAWCRGV